MSRHAQPDRPRLVQVVAEQSGPRTRVVDEHMYRVEGDWWSTTFRLQLFTSADGLRPVAVAIQHPAEDGSLTNRAETVVARVWREHFPDEPMPPVWVQRMMSDKHLGPDEDELGGWQMTIFDVQPDYGLANPSWPPLTQRELDQLVGCAVETDRGAGFIAPPPPPTRRVRYRLVPMWQMPVERPFREDCMPPAPGSRLGRWWARVTSRARSADGSARGCCWYHGGDWAHVIDTATRLLADVDAAGGVDDRSELRKQIFDAARLEELAEWQAQALDSLFRDPIVITAAEGRRPAAFINGQHRVRAMRDAGVAAVLVETTEPVSSAAITDQPGAPG